MKIYLLPGLGFDRRMFRNIQWGDLIPEFIDWIEPMKNEVIRSYAERMAESINPLEKKVVLIGHSFGGIMTQEIAEFAKIEKIILISSIKSRSENPLQFKILKPLGLHRIFTKEFSNATLKYRGSKYDYSTKEEQELFISMIEKHSNHYLQWALKQVSIWKTPLADNNTSIVQIHGTKDKNFPIKLIQKPDYIVKNGGHFMAFNMSDVIGEILRKEIEELI